MYELTRDGFVFLCMGFTGKKAAEFKEQYIAELWNPADSSNRIRQPPVFFASAKLDWQPEAPALHRYQ